MMKLLFYTFLGLFGISFITIGICGIWNWMLITEVIKRNREGPNLPLPRWVCTNWGQYEMIRFAEKVDSKLARKMKQLQLIGLIAFGGFLGFGVLVAITCEFVWKN